jgi:hypothetical protein
MSLKVWHPESPVLLTKWGADRENEFPERGQPLTNC